MWDNLLNMILMRSRRAQKAAQDFMEALQSEKAEKFLEVLLKLMGLVFFLDKDFQRNIRDFNGRYLFRSQDRQITVAAVFKDNRLKVTEEEIGDTHMTVIFRNAKALMGFLLSPKPDILGSMLRQDISIDGNLNYLYKFAYMAKHLQLKVTGKL
jgi:ubiquinone biosynthesis protein UbiJ